MSFWASALAWEGEGEWFRLCKHHCEEKASHAVGAELIPTEMTKPQTPNP